MRLTLTLISIFISSFLFSQKDYEKGFIQTVDGNTIEAYIRHWDWVESSKNLSYRTSPESKTQTIPINDIHSFEILDKDLKYERFEVTIDWENRSRKNSNTSNLKSESLLLRYLIDGETDLLEYGRSQNYFFYRTENNSPIFLVNYQFIEDNVVRNNAAFRMELFTKFKCQDDDAGYYKKLKYTRKTLTKTFEKINTCKGSEFTSYKYTKPLGQFNFGLHAGVNSLNLTQRLKQETGTQDLEFGAKTSVTTGIELEYLFNFNRRKWSIYTIPTYQTYKSDPLQTSVFGYPGTAEAAYSFLEIPLGIRHYLHLTESSKVFIQADYATIVSLNNDDVFDFQVDREFQVPFFLSDISGSNSSMSFGFGYKYKETYTLQIRYSTTKTVSDGNIAIGEFPGALMILLGYSIF